MKGNFFIVILLCILLAGGYGAWSWQGQKAEAKKTVEEWIQSNPVNAMILQDHPEAYPRFYSHFLKYYEDRGAGGLKDAQTEMQQIANASYLVDYMWYVSDAAVKDNLVREYVFLKALVENDKGKGKKKGRGICEKYLKNSALFQRARETAGGSLHDDYIRSSEELFKSALPRKLHPVWPGAPDFKAYVTQSLLSYTVVLRQLYPDSPELEAAFRDTGGQNCKTLLMLYYALLQMPPPQMSLLWRTILEFERTSLLEARKKKAAGPPPSGK